MKNKIQTIAFNHEKVFPFLVSFNLYKKSVIGLPEFYFNSKLSSIVARTHVKREKKNRTRAHENTTDKRNRKRKMCVIYVNASFLT
jgi:hypothetical protein